MPRCQARGSRSRPQRKASCPAAHLSTEYVASRCVVSQRMATPQPPGLAGSWAVGCAWSTRPPKISSITVGRELVVGGGLTPPDTVRSSSATGRSCSSPAVVSPGRAARPDPRTAERDARGWEGRAEETVGGDAELVVSDGPLTYFMPARRVGMVKRQSRSYLDASRSAGTPQLAPASARRSSGSESSAWSATRGICGSAERALDRRDDGGDSGLEVAASGGLTAREAWPMLTGAVLPRFAPAWPRPAGAAEPFPISALEDMLRHRLGDAAL